MKLSESEVVPEELSIGCDSRGPGFTNIPSKWCGSPATNADMRANTGSGIQLRVTARIFIVRLSILTPSIEERSIRFSCRTSRIRKCAARHLALGGERVGLNAPPLCSIGKQSA